MGIEALGARPPTLLVHHRRNRVSLVLAALFALFGVLLVAVGSPAEQLAGGTCTVVFGTIAATMALPRRRPPLLVLDEHGLTDSASRTAAGFLAWSSVIGVLEQRLRGQHYLSVLIENPGIVLAQADPSTRAAMRANLAMLGSPVNIPLRPLPIGVAELTLELARRTPSALPAALCAQLPADTPARPPATRQDLDDLAARAAVEDVALPSAYLELLKAQDGYLGAGLRIYASQPGDGLDGVLEANLAWRGDRADRTVTHSHTVLAESDKHHYAVHTSDGTFHVLARSDHQSLTQRSTFSDLMVEALEEFPPPFG